MNFQQTGCRYYEQRYPDMEDLVIVKVRTIQPTAAYCNLLEYGNVEGMIPLSEVSRRRIRSIGKHLRVGKTEVVQVFRVDKEKGYIDLSKKKVTEDDIRRAEERYNNAKAVHSIMSHAGVVWSQQPECDVENLEQLYERVAWPLARKYGSAHEAFKIANASPDKVFAPLELHPKLRDLFVKDIQERLKANPHRVRADIELTCFAYEGIDAVKEVLLEGQSSVGTETCPLKVTLTSCPAYVLRTQSLDRDEAFRVIESAIQKMTEMIKARGGNLKVAKPPTETSEDQRDKKAEDGASDSEQDDDSDSDDEDDEDEREIMAPSACPKRRGGRR
eukprot:TRINITY_DN10653_c0_g1_i1.p1 TRINITY_DN10653_c0_g1~~TRINITY_DN10653_c0_g1_i1.p1  ORF type:complete len:331 (+),score=133.04 TRINITY_DN10653_c0_g1_i1:77-1069(+)